MQHKTIALWLAGVLAVLIVAAAGAWSLTVATAYAYADEPAKAEAAQPTADAKAAEAAAATEPSAAPAPAKAQPADEAPGVYQLPLRAKASRAADPAAITPATFTISGKKFLSGRDLRAGEFTFHIAKLGAYTVPLGSKLSQQLRSAALSAAEKYDLVANGGLTYLNSAVQPLPNPDTATNAADGAVSFAPMTINASMLGETATRRTTGVVFAYAFSEEPPRNADGTLVTGVTKDSLGRYVYQGVTYDDTLKRAYLYAYQDYDADKNPVVKVVALGDAVFDAAPVRDQAGLGVGFRNTYHGTTIDDYDGVVYLQGDSISAGEFEFDVHEVAEDGSLLVNEEVACEASESAQQGAVVPILDGQELHQAGRFYFTVSQGDAGDSAPANVELDKTAYVLTVDVAPDAQGKLSANVSAVRKQEAGSDEWVDVDADAQPSPVVWENKLGAEEPSGQPSDEPSETPADPSPEHPGASGSATVPEGSVGADIASAPGQGATGAASSGNAGQEDGAHEAGDGAADATVSSQETEGAQVAPSHQQATGAAQAASADSADESSSRSIDNPLSRVLAQTGDTLAWAPLVLAAIALASAGVLVALRRRV